MERKDATKAMKVIIVGGGQVGTYLASLLLSNGHEIKVIEHRNKNFNKLLRTAFRSIN
ncbi:NAD-binding protein [Lacrimispora xylanisolvens]|uniref:NAD-binding protein n=1 Tax=Lacrimispora xylanisolvens TaxID=384636 RepID=UPI002402DAEC